MGKAAAPRETRQSNGVQEDISVVGVKSNPAPAGEYDQSRKCEGMLLAISGEYYFMPIFRQLTCL